MVVADDHPLMRQGIVSQLAVGNGIKVVGEASNGTELLQVLSETQSDVVLLDLQMPEMNGPQSLIQLKAKHPQIKVLVFSMFTEKRVMREMLRLGANGYLAKDVNTEHLVDAIYNVHYRGYHAQDDDMRKLMLEVNAQQLSVEAEVNSHDQLKERDLAILNMICEGMTSEEIAPKLSISKQTVDLSRARLISHFGVRNVVHLVAEAIRLGIYIP